MKKLLFFAAVVAMLFATSCNKDVKPPKGENPSDGMNPPDNSQPVDTCICFTAEAAGVTVQFNNIPALGNGAKIQYLLNDTGNWTDYTSGNAITLDTIGAKVYFRASVNHGTAFGTDSKNSSSRFAITKKVAVSGNIMSLYGPGCPNIELPDRAFAYMFAQCSALTDASGLRLPATTLADHCYSSMFAYCINLSEVKIYATGGFDKLSCLIGWLKSAGTEANNPTVHCKTAAQTAIQSASPDWTVTADLDLEQ